MVGNEENILVEFDYNNIIIIDPNKVIDENGTVVGVITGDVLQGSFTDSSNSVVTTIGYRTL